MYLMKNIISYDRINLGGRRVRIIYYNITSYCFSSYPNSAF